MAAQAIGIQMDMVRRMKLAELAGNEGVSDDEMLRLLIDRAHLAGLNEHNPEFALGPKDNTPSEG
jgi:hypothetical protein